MTRELGLACLLLAATNGLWAQGDDPPARVGRLSFLAGTVSFQPAGTDDWTDATLNYPVTTGDRLWADDQSRAEVHVGSSAIRLSMRTAFSFLNLDDQMVQVRLSEGALDITIRDLPQDQSFEVDTPNAAITLLRPGRYRIDGDPENMRTLLTIRSGEAEVTAGGFTVPARAQQALQITGDNMVSTNLIAPLPPDAFDRWSDERVDRESRRPPPRYVSREMVGYEDLDSNGTWRDEPGYGPVWAPRVDAGWAPYRFGRWAWVEPWGWTWIDDAPWGFAPFHYGRWASVGGSWVWVPGAVEARPVYAPALVAFVGGNSWSASLSFGGGGGVGWFPLGPREVYAPAYSVSPRYVTRINETHVTNVTNINVTNVTYVNQRVPGAVTAVSQADFAGSRSVGRVAVAVPAAAVASARVASTAAPVAPRAPGLVAAQATASRPVPRPPQAALNRVVVTKAPPPAPAVPFAARQAALAANPGKPVAPAALTEMRRSQPAPVQLVKPAAPAQPAQAQPRGPQPDQPAQVPAAQPPQRLAQPTQRVPQPAQRACPGRSGATDAAAAARCSAQPTAGAGSQRKAGGDPGRTGAPQGVAQPNQPAQPPVGQPRPPQTQPRPVQPPPAAQPAAPARTETPQRAVQPNQPSQERQQGRPGGPPTEKKDSANKDREKRGKKEEEKK